MKPSDLVKVKGLEWEHGDSCAYPWGVDGWHYVYWRWASDHDSPWQADYQHDWKEGCVRLGSYPTESSAKAACQAHYEAMIYELLEVR